MTETVLKVGAVTAHYPFYDLHSHTQRSDGLLSPQQLVVRAVEMRVNQLAITDHDTVAGLAEARQEITRLQLPLNLINGVEISTAWQSHDIHVVGLGFDPQHPLLVTLLAEQQQHRYRRAKEIALRLEKHRIEGALAGAERLAGEASVTRAHFARYLVEQRVETTITKVFKKYLAKGKIGYVPPQWCTMMQAVMTIQQAGGQAVLAHPHSYDLSAKWLRRLLVDFKQAGGDAIEVSQCQQTVNQRRQLAIYAQEYGFLASQGSDFHYPCAWIELGRGLWLPDGVEPVWQDWPINRKNSGID